MNPTPRISEPVLAAKAKNDFYDYRSGQLFAVVRLYNGKMIVLEDYYAQGRRVVRPEDVEILS